MRSRRRPIVLLILSLFVGGGVLYPLAALVTTSLRDSGAGAFGHFTAALDLSDPAAREAIGNSVAVSLLSVLFSGLLGLGFALVLTQPRFPFRRLLAGLAILPIALPPLVGVIAFLFAFGETGIIPR